MTKYYLVTEKELDMIKNDCAHTETNTCDGCEYEGKSGHNPITSFNPCTFKGANILMDEVLTRKLPSKVLKELERLHKACGKYDYYEEGRRDAFDVAIQIVKKGGKL
jgi:hypothetical protein